jgi:membrane associated rhomboid family serine protease
MLIPLRTDRQPRRRPLVTEGLIVLNLLVYLAGLAGQFGGGFDPEVMARWGHFDPRQFSVINLVTYQFLHDPHGVGHLAFNMLFLWVFGGAVEDRLGRGGFLGFYLLAGAVAALAHMMINRAPVIGASGSVAGVAGAFLALFPRSRIRVLLFFFIIGVYEIRSLWFIGLYVAIDLLRQTGALLGAGGSEVAYAAHLAGYAYGFATGFLLLATGILAHEEFDVFYLFRQARRRAAFRAATRGSAGGLWESASADTARRLEKQAARRAAAPPVDEEASALRGRVNQCVAGKDLAGAAAAYRKLLARDPDAVFAEERQVELANQLCREEHHAVAAAAYELLLDRYPHSRHGGEVSLMLALLYARRLQRPQRAAEIIRRVRSSLSSRDHLALADEILAELPT